MALEKPSSYTTVLDVTGLQCPLPVLKTQKALKPLESGEILEVISTDPMAAIDIPHFCTEHGHTFLGQTPENDAIRFKVRKK